MCAEVMGRQTFTFRASRTIEAGGRRITLDCRASWSTKTGTPSVVIQALRQQTRDELELQARQARAELEAQAGAHVVEPARRASAAGPVPAGPPPGGWLDLPPR